MSPTLVKGKYNFELEEGMDFSSARFCSARQLSFVAKAKICCCISRKENSIQLCFLFLQSFYLFGDFKSEIIILSEILILRMYTLSVI